MDLRSIYVSNGLGILILLMLQYVSRARIQRHRLDDRIYSFLVYGVMIGCLFEVLSYVIDGKTFAGARMLNYGLNTYLYSVNLALPFLVLVYVDLGLYDDPGRIWKCYKVQIIIGAVMISLNIVNYFVPIIYYITDQNVYERRPLSYLFYVAILYYFVSAILLTKRYEKENGAAAFFNIFIFLIPILLGAGLQFAFYGLSLAWLSSAVGLIGLFMMQQNEAAYIDALTGAYNRLYLNMILSKWIDQKTPFTGAMLDIDHFKWINDNFGHSEGDRALTTLVGALKQARADHEWVFRFAGDEFIILRTGDTEEGLEAYFKRVREKLGDQGDRAYPIRVSYGINCYTSGDIDSFLQVLDRKMYEMKEAHHREEDGQDGDRKE